MEKEQLIHFLCREYMREFLKFPEGNIEKLEFLNELIERVDPIKLPEKFDKDVFYQRLVTKIDYSEKTHRNELMKKAAVITILMGLGGNIVCEAATGKSIFQYIEEAVTEFRIDINDKKTSESTNSETKITEDIMEEFQEQKVSTWQEVVEKTKWDFKFPEESLPEIKQKNITLLMEGNNVTSITAEYEGIDDAMYYTFSIDHYENEVGANDFSLSDDAKKLESEMINDMRVVYYQEEEGVIAVGMEGNNIYQVITNDNFDNVKQVMEHLNT